MTCYQCQKTAREPVQRRCVSSGGVGFIVDLCGVGRCIATYRASLKEYGSRMLDE